MKILTAAQMRQADLLTIQAGIPSLVLMENAAHGCLRTMQQAVANLTAQRIVVLCGKGNNGGDGLALARLLWVHHHPASLQIAITHPEAELSPDALANLQMLRAAGAPAPVFSLQQLQAPSRATLVVDALLGTGLHGPAAGIAAEWIDAINTQFPDAEVLAVDLPSGMASDSGTSPGPFARADWTVTFTAPKPAHLLAPNADNIGQLTVVPIGTSAELLQQTQPGLEENEPSLWNHLLAPRPRAAHKGTFGHVLVIAGAHGKTGAAALSGWAALRMGAGLVTVATAAETLPYPELMTAPITADWLELAEGKKAVAIGPGLGQDPITQARIVAFLAACPLPVVVDADACNALAAQFTLGNKLHFAGPRLLTPHAGEMARLLGRPVGDRLADAREFVTQHGCHLLLKGQNTLLASLNQPVRVNATGTPAMATAGSGDVLTGMVAALAARTNIFDAASAAAHLHGLSGEIAAESLTESCVTATELLHFLPQAIRACQPPA